jgi:hypothetical protein
MWGLTITLLWDKKSHFTRLKLLLIHKKYSSDSDVFDIWTSVFNEIGSCMYICKIRIQFHST